MRRKILPPLLVFFTFFIHSKLHSQDLPNFNVESKAKSGAAKTGDPDINAFIPCDEQPKLTKKAMPKYPSLALQAKLEGKVIVKVLVDKTGKPKKSVVIKTDAEVFNDAASEAATSCVFSPAQQGGNPISYWAVVSYDFKLK